MTFGPFVCRCVEPDPAGVSPQQGTPCPQPLKDLAHLQRFGPSLSLTDSCSWEFIRLSFSWLWMSAHVGRVTTEPSPSMTELIRLCSCLALPFLDLCLGGRWLSLGAPWPFFSRNGYDIVSLLYKKINGNIAVLGRKSVLKFLP